MGKTADPMIEKRNCPTWTLKEVYPISLTDDRILLFYSLHSIDVRLKKAEIFASMEAKTRTG